MKTLSGPPTLHSELGTVESACIKMGGVEIESEGFLVDSASKDAGASAAASWLYIVVLAGKTSGHIKGLENARQPSPLPVFLTGFAVVGAQLVIGFVGCVVLGAWN
eukprot:CAMPEP_0177450080 /NCGR_PEP_ID=MMETSP0369-20130122/9060_1 /TAXON_ID=447022 ORGANISM="Scrippsiella hangoei-like, Strain SHHI-4" /NCGR_SAMPLE_ID=MMETSP0369 /ASSEMBLY_ACC=CAM_ASM_000364 /LENGTH=105 /DNA_ID=CAMNT_0018922615 /DNA_START=44 /DNA_END=359 /DNA_ORIENTATION=-